MTIRAILRHGIIQPIEPLPPAWAEGQELVTQPVEAEEPAPVDLMAALEASLGEVKKARAKKGA